MPLIICEINLILTWSADSVIYSTTGKIKFAKTNTKIYVPIVTLSAQDKGKLREQLKSGFRRTINRKKYQSIVATEWQNQYSDFLIDPGFQVVYRLFVLLFENDDDIKVHKDITLQK